MLVDVLLYRGRGDAGLGVYAQLKDTPYVVPAATIDYRDTIGYAVGDGFVYDGDTISNDFNLVFSDGQTTTDNLLDGQGNLIQNPYSFFKVGNTVYFRAFSDSVATTSFSSTGLYRFDGTGSPTLVFPTGTGGYGVRDDGVVTITGWDQTFTYYQFANNNGTITQFGETIASGSEFFEMNGELYLRDGYGGDYYRLNDDGTDFVSLNLLPGDERDFFSTSWVGETQFFFRPLSFTPGIGNEWHVSDGTAAGTRLVADINPGSGSSRVGGNGGAMEVIVGDRLFFTADNGSGDAAELWVSDGTTAGTIQLTGTGIGLGPLSFGNSGRGIAVGDLFFFVASGSGYSSDLFVSDGTVAGTQLVKAFDSAPDDFYSDGTDLYFTFAAGSGSSFPIWRSDGTILGTAPVTTLDDPILLGASFAYFSEAQLSLAKIGPLVQDGTNEDDQLDGTYLPETLNGFDNEDILNGFGGEDILSGGDGDDQLNGGRDDDTLNGGNGDDTLDGSHGRDTLNGDSGNDILSGDDFGDTLNGGSGDDVLIGGAGWDTLNGNSGEDILSGGVGNDRLNGGWDDDTLNGGSGNDTLDGSHGRDTLNGDSGNDILRGGDFGDTLNGGSGKDILIGGAGWDTLNGGAGGDRLFGGQGDDTLAGDAGWDTLRGEAGNDKLDGGSGNDNLNGGDGNDTLNGGVGSDQLSGANGADILNGDNGNDVLFGGDLGDTLNGGSGNDTLNGNAGWDTLNGGFGNDTLNGGGGNDTLNGGDGSDTFVFQSTSGSDTIEDFTDGVDIISIMSGALSFADVTVTDAGADTTISFSSVNITLENIDHTLIGSDDFSFI